MAFSDSNSVLDQFQSAKRDTENNSPVSKREKGTRPRLKEIFGDVAGLKEKLSRTRWWIQKTLRKPRKPYLPPRSFLCGPHFFGKEKFCTGAGRCMLSFPSKQNSGKTGERKNAHKLFFAQWGSPKASHIKASHPHFPHFPRFRVRIFCIFRVVALWNLLKPLFSWGQRDLLHFPHFRRIGFESLISKIRPTGFIVTGTQTF